MVLKDLIEFLSKQDQDLILPWGFDNPHSYRGYYEDLAFEPARYVRVSNMLSDARKALSNTYTGYKGGEFKMHEFTDCWIADYGRTGEGIGTILLSLMIQFGENEAANGSD